MQYYRHYKGNYYRMIGEALHSETLEEMVVYQAMYKHGPDGKTIIPAPEGGSIWVRPKKMFYEKVVQANGQEICRFEPLSEEEYNMAHKTSYEDCQTAILLEKLVEVFVSKGYSAEDFFGGCALCGDANEFALDLIDAQVKEQFPAFSKEEREQLTNRLYSELHQRLSC